MWDICIKIRQTYPKAPQPLKANNIYFWWKKRNIKFQSGKETQQFLRSKWRYAGRFSNGIRFKYVKYDCLAPHKGWSRRVSLSFIKCSSLEFRIFDVPLLWNVMLYSLILILLAFTTGNSSLEPLLEGLLAQIHNDLSWYVFGRNGTRDLRITQNCSVPRSSPLNHGNRCIPEV